ncbi:hypothetical protein SAMN05421753_105109 [Planctomicrobium piriforme]|uniref:Uncharacterized protein n=1 Tax=Planctomicrobium piriforme TaxID=1576369 RepID=A0A1I3F6Z3_9PLAN|nr:hypothetical protein SAMN05421753_105109 [Planctomicrobium piriforme]
MPHCVSSCSLAAQIEATPQAAAYEEKPIKRVMAQLRMGSLQHIQADCF